MDLFFAAQTAVSPMAERYGIFDEIEDIKRLVDEKIERMTELRLSARKSALTPARRRKGDRRLATSPGRQATSPCRQATSPGDASYLATSPTQSSNLYENVLMIREANVIAKALKKDTVC